MNTKHRWRRSEAAKKQLLATCLGTMVLDLLIKTKHLTTRFAHNTLFAVLALVHRNILEWVKMLITKTTLVHFERMHPHMLLEILLPNKTLVTMFTMMLWSEMSLAVCSFGMSVFKRLITNITNIHQQLVYLSVLRSCTCRSPVGITICIPTWVKVVNLMQVLVQHLLRMNT